MISSSFSLFAKSAAKVLLFFGLTKFLSNFFSKILHFIYKRLIFSVTSFSSSAALCRSLAFIAKSAAKVLLFFGLTKFLSNFFQYFFAFLRKWLIFSITFFSNFAVVSRSLALSAKSGAKVLLFRELTKYFGFFLMSIGILIHQSGKTGHISLTLRARVINNVRGRTRAREANYSECHKRSLNKTP